MGGIGSGTRSRKKRTVEDCRSLDAASLLRWGKLQPGAGLLWGQVLWNRDGQPTRAVCYDVDIPAGATGGTLRLLHHGESGDLHGPYAVGLVATKCHLGGIRWWFVCPQSRDDKPCGRRTRKLFLCGAAFACRHCHGLTYVSRQRSDKRVAAALQAGTDLTEFEPGPDTTLRQAAFAFKVFQADDARRERMARRAIRRMRPDVRAEFLRLTGRPPEA